jgi:hypothetical protein
MQNLSKVAYPNLFGIKGFVVIVVVEQIKHQLIAGSKNSGWTEERFCGLVEFWAKSDTFSLVCKLQE